MQRGSSDLGLLTHYVSRRERLLATDVWRIASYLHTATAKTQEHCFGHWESGSHGPTLAGIGEV